MNHGGAALTHIANKVDRWQRGYGQAMPYATVGVLTLAVISFHALFQFNVGLEALYIVPIWLSIRLLGSRVSLATVVAISFFLTLTHPQIGTFTGTAIVAGFAIRLIGFTLIAMLISWFESSYSEARGLAFTDPLTGLLNRHGLADLRKRLFGNRTKEAVVVMLDCDGFKQINDRYGHTAGDHILKILARILENETRSSDALVRMGGDEFALILNSANGEEAKVVLERVQNLFEQYVADAGYDCSISFGIAEPDEEEDLDEVLAKADAAMYDHKYSKRQASYLS